MILRLSAALVLAAPGAGATPASKDAPRIPVISRALDLAPGLHLGMEVKDLIAGFSTKELDSTTRGERIFDINANSLPENAHAIRCIFVDGKLVYEELKLRAAFNADHPWLKFVGAPIAKFGTPASAEDSLSAKRLFLSEFSDSAVFTDKSTTLVFGRADDGYDLAVLDAKFVGALSKELVTADASRAQSAAAASAAAENEKQEHADVAAAKNASDAQTENLIGELKAASDEVFAFLASPEKGSADSTRAAASRLIAAMDAAPASEKASADIVRLLGYMPRLRDSVADADVQISAALDWQGTGVYADAGDKVVVTASGRWRMSPNWPESGPEGVPGKSTIWAPYPTVTPGALICRIGPQAVYPVVEKGTLTPLLKVDATARAEVECRANDSALNDNSGVLNVHVLAYPAFR